jgi:hypothetical protein
MSLVRTAELLAAATATSAQPSAATDGVVKPSGVDRVDLFLRSTAGSGDMEVTVRLWGYQPEFDEWFPLSIGSGAGDAVNRSGWMNGGAPIEESGADEIRHYEAVENLSLFGRLYAQVVAIGGTSTAVDLDVVWHRAEYR